MTSKPLMLDEKKAAKEFSLSLAEFKRLVKEGYLPMGLEIAPGVWRWSYDLMHGIANGKRARPDGGLEL